MATDSELVVVLDVLDQRAEAVTCRLADQQRDPLAHLLSGEEDLVELLAELRSIRGELASIAEEVASAA